jgi:hypothetical protein
MLAERVKRIGVDSARSALLLRFAIDADTRPGNCFKTRWGDWAFAFHADAIGAMLDAMDCLFDSAQKFGVGLFEGKPYVKVAFLAGLIDPIAALGSRFGRGRADWRRRQQFISLLVEKVLVFLYV